MLSFLLFILMQIIVVVLVFGILILFLMACDFWCFTFFCVVNLLNFNTGYVLSRAAAIPRAKGGTLLQMKLVYNHLAPLFLLLLQWMKCSCTCFLHRYLDLFHIVVYKVNSLVDGYL